MHTKLNWFHFNIERFTVTRKKTPVEYCLLPPIIAESLLIASAKGSPSSIGPEWSVAEIKKAKRKMT